MVAAIAEEKGYTEKLEVKTDTFNGYTRRRIT